MQPSDAPSADEITAAMHTMLDSMHGEGLPAVNLFFRVLDLAAESPGGWHELIAGIQASGRAEEVVAFCRSFTMVLACANNTVEDAHCVHDAAYAI